MKRVIPPELQHHRFIVWADTERGGTRFAVAGSHTYVGAETIVTRFSTHPSWCNFKIHDTASPLEDSDV